MKLSAVLIVKNEEKNIKKCLETLGFCDEIIVVDDGSEDSTIKIAKEFTEKVFKNENRSKGYVEAVRKFGISKATGEWILIIDADERVTPALAVEIKKKITNNHFSAFTLTRKNYYLGNHPWPVTEKIQRVFKTEEIRDWDWKLHESPPVKGEVGNLEGVLIHYTHSDLASMLNKTIQWSDVEAKARFESGHPKMSWWRFPRVMLTAFFNYYVLQSGWRIGTAGLIESFYQSFSAFVTYAKLWELQMKNSKSK